MYSLDHSTGNNLGVFMKDNCIPDTPVIIVDVLEQQGGSIGCEPGVPPMLHGLKNYRLELDINHSRVKVIPSIQAPPPPPPPSPLRLQNSMKMHANYVYGKNSAVGLTCCLYNCSYCTTVII